MSVLDVVMSIASLAYVKCSNGTEHLFQKMRLPQFQTVSCQMRRMSSIGSAIRLVYAIITTYALSKVTSHNFVFLMLYLPKAMANVTERN